LAEDCQFNLAHGYPVSDVDAAQMQTNNVYYDADTITISSLL